MIASLERKLSLSMWEYMTPGNILDYINKYINVEDERAERKDKPREYEIEAGQREFDEFERHTTGI